MLAPNTTQKELQFNPKMFNPLFWKLKAKTRYVISYGGAGSSKSYTQGQREVIGMLKEKEKVLVLRKVAATLKDSVIPLINEELIGAWGISGDFDYNKSDRVLTNKINGSQMLFRGMDDPEKIKSIQGITRIWIEEGSEFDEADINQLNIRIRGREELQITITFNPIDELHWLKKKFFDGDEDVTIIKTTYLDNRFIDKAFVKELDRYRTTDPNFYKIYALGEWGCLTKGGEFYKFFNALTHVQENEYDPDAPLHITFDENVNPWLTCNVWQAEGLKAWQIDEIALEDPNNTLDHTLKEFAERYPNNGQTVFVYGDATSKKADAKLEKGKNLYTMIEKFLIENGYSYQLRVPASNPNVSLRGNFINQILLNKFDGIDLSFAPHLKKTIADYQYLKQAQDGSKHKEHARHPTTKVAYQRWGHMTDANDYFILVYFDQSFRRFKAPNTATKRVIVKRQVRGSY